MEALTLSDRRRTVPGGWGAIWCLVPLGLTFIFPDRFTQSVLALAAVWALYAASWDLLAGWSGQVSLGHALPFGIGAYSAAFLPLWSSAPSGGALAYAMTAGALMGALQGSVGARLNQTFLAVVTLATAECAHELSEMLQVSGPGRVVFGGDAGVPAPGFPFDETGTARLAAVMLALGLAGLWGLARSNFGVAVRTVHAGEQAAAASGIDVVRVRVAAFVISGALAGLGGGFAAGLAGRASPSMLSLSMTLFPVAAAAIGGVGTLFGPASSAYALAVGLHWADISGPARLAFFALVITGAGLAAPQGIARMAPWLRLRPTRQGWRTGA